MGTTSRHNALMSDSVKHMSYRYAFARMKESLARSFYLECVMIAESIISDRLLSATSSTEVKRVNQPRFVSLATLIGRAKGAGVPAELVARIDSWRACRNEVAHAVARSEPGRPTMPVKEFLALAKRTASEGVILAGVIRNWKRETSRASSKRSSTKQFGRTALFSFTRCSSFAVDASQMTPFVKALGLVSLNNLKTLAKSVDKGTRKRLTERAYAVLDERLLPRLETEVFFENFSEPERIFVGDAGSRRSRPIFRAEPAGARIVEFTVSEGGGDEGMMVVTMAVEASYLIKVRPGLDIEAPDDIEDAAVQDQLIECRNMFNFSIRGFEYEDDEVLDHDWSARWSADSHA